MLRHINSVQQFIDDKKLLEDILKSAAVLQGMAPGSYPDSLKNKVIITLFYEPSTRTRLSFESAAHRLGGSVVSTENAGEFSSAAKGETLEDTILTVGGYADAIVIRHSEKGAAMRAASVSKVPIINAGDGAGEHPTQALLDLYTIQKAKGKIDGLKIAMVGDLKNGRTVHSLSRLLTLYQVELFFVSPVSLQMPDDNKEILAGARIKFHEKTDLKEILPEVDVVYMTRIQKERFENQADYEEHKNAFLLDVKLMKSAKKDAIILHPLPRNSEISPDVDSDPRAIYFQQAHNGLYVRMALLQHLLQS